MKHLHKSIASPLLLALIGALAWMTPDSSLAQEVSAEAVLLSDRIATGETSHMIIRTINGAPSEMPAQIVVPGLTISRSREQIVQHRDSSGTNVSEYHFYYRISGQTEGTFTIPAMNLRVNNQSLTTKPMEVTVFARKPGDEVLDAKLPYFSKLVLSEKEFYAGQIIPAEIKIYVRGVRSIHDIGRPKLKHEQVVVKGFTQAIRDGVQLDGIQFSSAKLDGSIFVLAPGKYEIGPAEIDVRMLESNRFGNIGFFESSTVRPLRSDAIPVVVKSLPEADKPDSFRGAIGEFQMTVTAKPRELKVGDPISLEFEIKGAGNLNSVEAPVLLAPDPENWRTYDARKMIDPEEESDGKKPGRMTFSQIIMPRSQVSEIPPFELAFFDPESGTYGTQKTKPLSIIVAADERIGGPAAAATTVPGLSGGTFAQSAAATPEASFDDILFISVASPKWRQSAVPASILSRPGFWIAQAIPSIALFTILGMGLTRFARNRAALKLQKASEMRFERAMADFEAAPDRGAHYHAIQNALAAWQRESRVPAEKLPDAARSGFQALQARSQWILYGAPDSERDRPLSGQEQQENRQILDALAGYLG